MASNFIKNNKISKPGDYHKYCRIHKPLFKITNKVFTNKKQHDKTKWSNADVSGFYEGFVMNFTSSVGRVNTKLALLGAENPKRFYSYDEIMELISKLLIESGRPNDRDAKAYFFGYVNEGLLDEMPSAPVQDRLEFSAESIQNIFLQQPNRPWVTRQAIYDLNRIMFRTHTSKEQFEKIALLSDTDYIDVKGNGKKFVFKRRA